MCSEVEVKLDRWKVDQNENVVYECFADIVHSGCASAGHYIAYVR